MTTHLAPEECTPEPQPSTTHDGDVSTVTTAHLPTRSPGADDHDATTARDALLGWGRWRGPRRAAADAPHDRPPPADASDLWLGHGSSPSGDCDDVHPVDTDLLPSAVDTVLLTPGSTRAAPPGAAQQWLEGDLRARGCFCTLSGGTARYCDKGLACHDTSEEHAQRFCHVHGTTRRSKCRPSSVRKKHRGSDTHDGGDTLWPR